MSFSIGTFKTDILCIVRSKAFMMTKVILADCQPCQLVKNDMMCHQILMMRVEIVPETYVICNQLTWLIAHEDFINTVC
jgi:hypothetical protein